MQYAFLESGREVSALDLSNGTTRSNSYNCICCGSTVSYVVGSYRSKPHFRHKHNESCIDYSLYTNIAQDANDRIENRKSKYHKDWQSIFHKDTTEVRVKENNKLHIADVYLQNSTPIRIATDNNINILNNSINNLVIEIQHSHISLCDAKNRELFYVTDKRALIWIVNITDVQHKIEQFITLTQDKTRVLFPEKQHSGLSNIIRGCKKSVIILDNGTYLFKVVDAHLDSSFMEVLPISKTSFLKHLNIEPQMESSYKKEVRNYKDYICSLDEAIIVDIDEIINMIEDISLPFLRKTCKYSLEPYTYPDTYVKQVTVWLSCVSNNDPLVYKMLDMWIRSIRKTQYNTERIGFGKYKYTPLCNIPQQYLIWVFEESIIHDEELNTKIEELCDISMIKCIFHNASNFKLVNLKRCRDNYRIQWDRRSNQDRLAVLNSILRRPWINMIDEVTPDEDGFVCTCDYILNKSYEFKKHHNMNNATSLNYRFKALQVGTKYIAISQDDVIYWYGVLDDIFCYDYRNKIVRPPKTSEYAFIDI